MKRRYAPLRSAPATARSRSISIETPEIKRRRLGVLVAGGACRRRKIRCDGQRPVCTNCLGSSNECAYRDESDLSHESRKLVVEVIRILNSIPAGEAIRTLRLLSRETNAPIILSTLRDEVTGRKEPKATSDTAATPKETPGPLEFEVQNPTAYPVIILSDCNNLDKKLSADRSRSAVANWTPCVESPSGNKYQSSTDSEYDIAHNLSAKSMSPTPTGLIGGHSITTPPELCNPCLRELEIQFWTDVEIDNDVAAKCISLYLETDHPLLGHFDPDLFLSDLIHKRYEYCSSLLVNAMLYWACMYSSIDPNTSTLALSFCAEAEKFWDIERSNSRDTITTLAAAEFLCLGYLGEGRDHTILTYISDASQMGQRMGLFGVEYGENIAGNRDSVEVVDDATRARMYTAWGVFNWITLMSLFYRQPGMNCPKHPPQMVVPDCTKMPSLQYMGTTFPQICRFWTILHEVTLVYTGDGVIPWGSRVTLPFAEYKFRELLAWSNNLPSRLTQGYDHLHHVQILHLWFHAAILDIFRPCVKGDEGERQLRTFSDKYTTPNAVCVASVAQLKHLIADYRLNYRPSYTILWHTALVYVINAILNGKRLRNWYADLLLCIYAYESLNRSWRVAAGIAKGLLSLAMQKSDLPSRTARRILHDIENDQSDQIPGEIRATFMADLDLALSNPSSATVEHLAKPFESNVLLKDFTTFWEDGP